jgi:hypothetical protein
VLNETLLQASREGVFPCKSIFLGSLMKAARHRVTWGNYSGIAQAVAKRNALAHRGALLPRGECWRYISVIEDELRSWSVLP